MKTRMIWIVSLAAVAWATNGVAAQPNPATQPDTAKQAGDAESTQASGANAPGGNESTEGQSGVAKPLPPAPSPAAAPPSAPQTNARVPGYPPPPPAGYPGYPPARPAPGPWGYPGYSPYPGYYGYGPPPPPPPVPTKPPAAPKPPDRTKHLHDGLYFGCSLGPMMLHDSASANDKKLGTASAGGLALSLALGGTPVDGLVLGGTFLGQASVGGNIDPALNASSRDEDTEIGAAFLGGFVDYFFDPRKGFHMQGLVGIQKLSYSYRDYTSEQSDDPDDRTRPISSSSGVAFGLGVGNLWWVRPQWSIGLVGRLMFAPRLSGINRFSDREETHTLMTASLGAELVLH